MPDGRACRRLVRQFDRCFGLQNLSRRRPISRAPSQSLERLAFGATNWQCLGPDAEFDGPYPDQPDGRLVHLWRNALGPERRPLHPGSTRERLARHFLSVHSHGLTPANPGAGGSATDPIFRARRRAAVASFLGSASTAQFARDTTNLTVSYSGSSTDFSYRRMILHYANLCVVAGGVDLFLIGSELRGLEIIRGPGWTKAGGVDGSGKATWDYPFVAGLTTARRRCALGLRRRGSDQEPDDLEKPHCLFRRLVELERLAASRRERPMAASRQPVRFAEYRRGFVRQLPAAVRLDARRRRARRQNWTAAAPRPGRRPPTP